MSCRKSYTSATGLPLLQTCTPYTFSCNTNIPRLFWIWQYWYLIRVMWTVFLVGILHVNVVTEHWTWKRGWRTSFHDKHILANFSNLWFYFLFKNDICNITLSLQYCSSFVSRSKYHRNIVEMPWRIVIYFCPICDTFRPAVLHPFLFV